MPVYEVELQQTVHAYIYVPQDTPNAERTAEAVAQDECSYILRDCTPDVEAWTERQIACLADIGPDWSGCLPYGYDGELRSCGEILEAESILTPEQIARAEAEERDRTMSSLFDAVPA